MFNATLVDISAGATMDLCLHFCSGRKGHGRHIVSRSIGRGKTWVARRLTVDRGLVDNATYLEQ